MKLHGGHFTHLAVLILGILIGVVIPGRDNERPGTPASGLASQANSRPFESEKLAKARKIQELEKRRQVEIGALSTNSGPPVPLLKAGHEINENTLRELGVSEEKTTRVQEMVDKAWSDMAESTKARARFEEQPEGAEFDRIYHIEADPVISNEVLASLESALISELGSKTSSKVFPALKLKDHFGGFGQQDVTIKTKYDESFIGDDKQRVVYECRDPETGKVLREGSTGAASFANHFGTRLDF